VPSDPGGSPPLPSGMDHLRTIVGHHTWATLQLIDRCLQLSAEQLELSTPGTFGSLHATLNHLVVADRRYLRGITGEEAGPPSQGPAPLTTLRAEMERQARRWRDVLDHVDEIDATMPAIEGPDPYPEIEHAVGLFIVQAVHHGQEHRAHVCSILGAQGLEVPDVTGWDYILVLRSERGAAPA
jgi:uncharacterized damage-inducible protein DinB